MTFIDRIQSWDRYTKAAAILIFVLSVFRLFFCTHLELVPDEAYYWVWSWPQHLDICYFSKGPFVAWLIALGTYLFGDNEFGVRFFSVILGAGTGTLLFLVAKQLFTTRIAFWSLVVGSTIPLYAIGSLLMTIDPISVFFWGLAAYLFWQAKDETEAKKWGFIGLFMGLGMLAKYTNVAEAICFTLFLLWVPQYRHHFRRSTYWTMLLVMIACLFPVVLWNYKHDWITIQHLIHRGNLDQPFRFSPNELFQFITSQFMVVTPLYFLGMLISLFIRKKVNLDEVRYKYLVTLFVPLIAFYVALSINDSGQPNWTAPSFFTGIILLTAVFIKLVDQKVWIKRLAILSIVIAALATIVMHETFWLNLPPKKDPLTRLRGGENLGEIAHDLRDEYGTFIISNKYSHASTMAFYSGGHIRTFMPRSAKMENQYSFWADYRKLHLPGESAMFIADTEDIPEVLREDFEEVTPFATFETEYKGRPIQRFWVTFCARLKAKP
jgi:4-amino-4-deoxy-L-arabinose transferase-like glycosyltransferase